MRTARAVAPPGVTAALYEDLGRLPAFNPDHDRDPLPPVVVDLRRRIDRADAVLLCAPEYAGALPGSFKNLLDWTVGGGEIHGKPVAWINVAAEGRGSNADLTLVTALGYVGATVIDAACRRIPVARDEVGADGVVHDADIRAAIAVVVRTIVEHLRTTAGA